ncbi:hypothetical protein BDQ94DRAFT_139182 [Aspergillus welwitschiae]|uniref:Uncharacterized protein n=1 Tax=Aspergillus welwitschiae TaxID=1341132 RepID=A0A3F3Q949_9EURO|nr:hypothetical protein BDQ94DRAFT_139182 [Aspergillus welwitschiae]RDH35754.1 hypothetical protein BDQ94DRAFT_139182 [Aspergillus welwitschiae]
MKRGKTALTTCIATCQTRADRNAAHHLTVVGISPFPSRPPPSVPPFSGFNKYYSKLPHSPRHRSCLPLLCWRLTSTPPETIAE